MTDSSINIGYCSCKDHCERWQLFDDNSVGFFCPYVPESIDPDASKCKKLHNDLGKDIGPTIVKRKNGLWAKV
jgi:hypothetical protein